MLPAFLPTRTHFVRLLSTTTTPFRMPPKRNQKRSGRTSRSSEPSPLKDFFARYHPQFEYDTTESASHEFYRLCNVSGWDRDHPDRNRAHRDFKDALVHQFNRVYGTEEDKLRNWQNLCQIVHIEPIPDDLKACREVVRGTYVNIVDLVDTNTTGEEVEVFGSERELSEYTKLTGKFFPRKNAYAGGLLRYLLRHILNPTTVTPSRRRIKRRR